MGAKKGSKIAFGLKSQPKAPRPAAFAPASDSEDEEPEQDQKRQRRSFTGLGSFFVDRKLVFGCDVALELDTPRLCLAFDLHLDALEGVCCS